MNTSVERQLRTAAVIVAIAAPAISHIALRIGQGYGIALGLEVAQALAAAIILRGLLPARAWVGPAVAATLLLALAAGCARNSAAGLLAMSGTAHALLYTGLLALFAASLRPGRRALVTWLAARINPRFHTGMVPYTRAVTWAWTLLFAAQLATSALLLATDLPLWQTFVTILHIYAVIAFAVAEALLRRWRWRHEQPTSLLDTIRGVRGIIAQRARPSTTS